MAVNSESLTGFPNDCSEAAPKRRRFLNTVKGRLLKARSLNETGTSTANNREIVFFDDGSFGDTGKPEQLSFDGLGDSPGARNERNIFERAQSLAGGLIDKLDQRVRVVVVDSGSEQSDTAANVLATALSSVESESPDVVRLHQSSNGIEDLPKALAEVADLPPEDKIIIVGSSVVMGQVGIDWTTDLGDQGWGIGEIPTVSSSNITV